MSESGYQSLFDAITNTGKKQGDKVTDTKEQLKNDHKEVNQYSMTIKWECVEGHENSVVLKDINHNPKDIIETMRNWDADDKIECGFCAEVGTDDGIYYSSADEYIRAIIDYAEYLEHGD